MNDSLEKVEISEDKMLRAEVWISYVLRGGVFSSVLLIFLGLVITFFHHPQYVESATDLKKLVEPGAAFPRTLPEVARGISSFQGRAVVVAGLLVLILTPILRVAISIVAFVELGDRSFILITSAVLFFLLLSLFLGAAD